MPSSFNIPGNFESLLGKYCARELRFGARTSVRNGSITFALALTWVLLPLEDQLVDAPPPAHPHPNRMVELTHQVLGLLIKHTYVMFLLLGIVVFVSSRRLNFLPKLQPEDARMSTKHHHLRRKTQNPSSARESRLKARGGLIGHYSVLEGAHVNAVSFYFPFSFLLEVSGCAHTEHSVYNLLATYLLTHNLLIIHLN